MARRGVFVTGTDTGVGKTVLSAAIATVLREGGERVAAAKPVLSGTDEAGPHDHEVLAAATGQDADDIAPVRFGPPVSPHLAAQLAGATLEVGDLVERTLATGAPDDVLVVEGVGGLLVPLSPRASVRDLAVALGLPVVVAARPALGTINHTLLTLEAARAAALDVRAVVLTPWPADPSPMEVSNAETITALGGVPAAHLPFGGRVPDLPAADWLGPARRTPPPLDHVVIAVSDWERSNAFYRDVVGADVVRA